MAGNECQPFMGDARNLQEETILDLKKLYYQAFLSFAKICSQKTKIVFIFPEINLKNQTLNTLDKKAIASCGWQQIHSPFGELIYQRPGQTVTRNITLWQRQ